MLAQISFIIKKFPGCRYFLLPKSYFIFWTTSFCSHSFLLRDHTRGFNLSPLYRQGFGKYNSLNSASFPRKSFHIVYPYFPDHFTTLPMLKKSAPALTAANMVSHFLQCCHPQAAWPVCRSVMQLVYVVLLRCRLLLGLPKYFAKPLSMYGPYTVPLVISLSSRRFNLSDLETYSYYPKRRSLLKKQPFRFKICLPHLLQLRASSSLWGLAECYIGYRFSQPPA